MTKPKKLSSLWTEKYRPKSLDDVIFQDDNQRDYFMRIRESGEIPMMLLHGIQGVGKTSIAYALLHDLKFPKADFMKVDASVNNGIDTVRNMIEHFATQMPVKASYRVVLLEEFDNFSEEGQKALRVTMEQYTGHVRYILTCNNVNKIFAPIMSRMTSVNFMSAPDHEQVLIRLLHILAQEGIEYSDEDLETIFSACYPDIRKMIQNLEDFSKSGKLVMRGVSSASGDWRLELAQAVNEQKFKTVRDVVVKIPKEMIPEFYRICFTAVRTNKKMSQDVLENQLLILAEHDFKHASVGLPELNMIACIIRLGRAQS